MATDIFKQTVQHGGSWKLDGAIISIEGNNDDLIVNNCNIQYQRPVNKINPLNNNKQYIIAGRGSGVVSLGIIVGPSTGVKQFLEKFTDPCEIATNSLTIKAANVNQCPGGTGADLEFVCNYCLLQGITASVQAGDLSVLSAGCSLIVGALSLK